jgi:hypothetical protein
MVPGPLFLQMKRVFWNVCYHIVKGKGSLSEGEGAVQLTSCISYIRSAPFKLNLLFTFLTTQATLIRWSTVVILPPQLVFPAIGDMLTH